MCVMVSNTLAFFSLIFTLTLAITEENEKLTTGIMNRFYGVLSFLFLLLGFLFWFWLFSPAVWIVVNSSLFVRFFSGLMAIGASFWRKWFTVQCNCHIFIYHLAPSVYSFFHIFSSAAVASHVDIYENIFKRPLYVPLLWTSWTSLWAVSDQCHWTMYCSKRLCQKTCVKKFL